MNWDEMSCDFYIANKWLIIAENEGTNEWFKPSFDFGMTQVEV